MNGYGLAGLAKGFNEGFTSTITGLTALGKDKREAELFGLQKQKLQREEDEAVRKTKMQEQVAADMQALQEEIASAEQPLSELAIDRRRAAIFQKARIDHKFMDEDAWEKQRKINKVLTKEGFEEAYRIFEETGDSDAAISAYASAGKNKPPPGAFMRREMDETGFPDVVVYAPGPDGKPRRLTSRFEYSLATMPEELVRYGTKMKEVGLKEKGDTFRTGMTTQATLAAAAAKGEKDLNPEVKDFNRRMEKDFESISKLTGLNLDPQRETVIRAEISKVGRGLIDKDGYNSSQAYDAAIRTVYSTYGIPLPQPVKQAPKK